MADDLARLFAKIGDIPAQAVAESAALVVDIAVDEARRATGDGRMSGMGRRGPRLRAVVVNKKQSASSASVVVRGVPAGAWAILESGASPHVIRPRQRRLYGPGMRHPVSTPVRHPGARGKRTWSRVLTRPTPRFPTCSTTSSPRR